MPSRLPWRSAARRPTDPLVADLVDAVGADQVRASSAARHLAATDASVYTGGAAGPSSPPATRPTCRPRCGVAGRHGRPVVPRGAGTGLAGGTVPLGEPVVIATTRMNGIGPIDAADRVCWVEPGVVNLDLSRHLRPHGFHFAPDPSSQQVCTIGGNVANNSGGPHCLAYGVTSAHVLAVELVTIDGEVVVLGGADAEPAGLDLRGVVVGSEGMLGVVTRAAVRLTPNPACVSTLLLAFDDVAAAAARSAT